MVGNSGHVASRRTNATVPASHTSLVFGSLVSIEVIGLVSRRPSSRCNSRNGQLLSLGGPNGATTFLEIPAIRRVGHRTIIMDKDLFGGNSRVSDVGHALSSVRSVGEAGRDGVEVRQGASSPVSFRDFGLIEPLLDALTRLGHVEPTPIQRKAIEPALAGRGRFGLCADRYGKNRGVHVTPFATVDSGRSSTSRHRQSNGTQSNGSDPCVSLVTDA